MKLLIVGKTCNYLSEAGKIAHQKGADVTHSETTEQALTHLRSGKGAELIMIDTKNDIKKFVDRLRAEHINIDVVACGLGDNAEEAVKAIESGAKEYIPLPPDTELIAAILLAVTEDNHALIHQDQKTTTMLELAKQVAPSDASILITGESGTGKEVIARFIHKNSNRKNKAFISVNCAAIPENLLESELFGHEKGAFTGAIARRIGKFEEANGGTLLLDEISEMHPLLQAKLLRAIQEREIDRVGGSKPIKINIRLLATSNRDLKKAVAEGKFREDLYFRLNVINIQIPPLRERPGDIEPIAHFYIEKYCSENNLAPKKLAAETLQALKNYHWPGNVRELENTMHRAILISTGSIIEPHAIMLDEQKKSSIPSTTSNNSNNPNNHNGFVERTIADTEREVILGTLEHCLGNRTHAATILGISIRTLRNKLKQYTEQGIAIPSSGQINSDMIEKAG